MANRERGEFRLTAGEDSYVLQLTTNACAELEDFTNRPFDQIQKGAQRGFVRDLRLIIWASLWEKHPDIAQPTKESLKAVGKLMDKGGGVIGLHAQMLAFIALNADSGEDGGDANAADPPSAQADGTGDSSTSMRLALA